MIVLASPTYSLIASNTVSGSSTTSIVFSSIPSTYTDLVVKASVRSSRSANQDLMRTQINSDASALYSWTYIMGDGASATSSRGTGFTYISDYRVDGNTATSNTFGSLEMYIPSYTASQNKPIGGISVSEDNATAGGNLIVANAALYRSTTAISSISFTLDTGPNFVSGSTFYLYGIKSA